MPCSINRLLGYSVQDQFETGEIGRLEDLFFEEHSWKIVSIKVSTGVHLSGRDFLLPTSWVARIDHSSRRILLTNKNKPNKFIRSSQLNSLSSLLGFRLENREGIFWHIRDLFLEETSWSVLFFLITESRWNSARIRFIPIDAIQGIYWGQKTVYSPLSQSSISDSPEYLSDQSLSQEKEPKGA